jgi:hypothetical protein
MTIQPAQIAGNSSKTSDSSKKALLAVLTVKIDGE